ncbi:MAG: peroxiredoxin [Paracoccaceae bacterium]
MTISEGDTLPDATLMRVGADGPEAVALSSLTAGRKVAIFGVPGAYTGTCTTAHVPSFLRTRSQFTDKGVDAVICVAVNDPFVMDAWATSTGAAKGGIEMLADPAAELTKALGLDFTAPPAGLYDRSKRYAMLVEDGRVTALNVEDNPGVCDTSGGEALLERA